MNTEISRYLVDANGNSFSSDTDLQSLSKNAKVKNTNSGVSYKKVQGTTSGVPVFDKVPFQEGQSDAVLYSPQSLTSAQKQQARTNIGASGGDAVLYDTVQQLTEAQKQQARQNIGALGSASFPISYSKGTITHGESYTEIIFALGPSSTTHFYNSFVVRIGSIDLGDIYGFAASVRWETPFWEHEISDMKVQVTPSRGSNDGDRWGDDYFCLFTQNISHEGFDIFSNHLSETGGKGGRIDYIFTATLLRAGASGSSSSGGSSSSNTQTWGVTKFNTINSDVGQPTMSVGQTVSEGKIVKIYALTHWAYSSGLWTIVDYTDYFYVWKDNNYTLTNADKSQINSLPSRSSYGPEPQALPHVTLSYNSGNI